MNYSAVILAAGRGSRSGLSFNKVLFPWKNRPLLWQSIDLFRQDPDCRQIIIVCAPHEREEFEQEFSGPDLEFVLGGDERQDSVRNGLQVVSQPYVMIHDGARPFCSVDLLDRIKSALEKSPAVIPGIAVVDTIKEVDENGFVIHTPQRSSLRAIQTPQAFETGKIREALDLVAEKNLSVTDDAQALEVCLNIPSLCVEGDPANIKITSKRDIEALEAQSW